MNNIEQHPLWTEPILEVIAASILRTQKFHKNNRYFYVCKIRTPSKVRYLETLCHELGHLWNLPAYIQIQNKLSSKSLEQLIAMLSEQDRIINELKARAVQANACKILGVDHIQPYEWIDLNLENRKILSDLLSNDTILKQAMRIVHMIKSVFRKSI